MAIVAASKACVKSHPPIFSVFNRKLPNPQQLKYPGLPSWLLQYSLLSRSGILFVKIVVMFMSTPFQQISVRLVNSCAHYTHTVFIYDSGLVLSVVEVLYVTSVHPFQSVVGTLWPFNMVLLPVQLGHMHISSPLLPKQWFLLCKCSHSRIELANRQGDRWIVPIHVVYPVHMHASTCAGYFSYVDSFNLMGSGSVQ